MNTISFISANFVARELGYSIQNIIKNWSKGDQSVNNTFRPLETFSAKFEEILIEVKELGFSAIDIWVPHLNPAWATKEHIDIAKQLLHKHNLVVPNLSVNFGDNKELFKRNCALAAELGAKTIGGLCIDYVLNEPKEAEAVLKDYGILCGYENHPEKNPTEILDKFKNIDSDRIGLALDTGWFGTEGYDAAKAIRELYSRIQIQWVHLKDVRAPGGHETCAFGDGVVPIPECITALKELGYTETISIEHEPGDYDPREECRANLNFLRTFF